MRKPFKASRLMKSGKSLFWLATLKTETRTNLRSLRKPAQPSNRRCRRPTSQSFLSLQLLASPSFGPAASTQELPTSLLRSGATLGDLGTSSLQVDTFLHFVQHLAALRASGSLVADAGLRPDQADHIVVVSIPQMSRFDSISW